MKPTADVVIIGAGIQGLSAAYHLAKLGIPEVVVVEKEYIGSGSSGRSATMFMLQVSGELKIRLSLYCFERIKAFEAETGSDPEYIPIGTLLLVDADSADSARLSAEQRQQMGIDTRILTPDEITQMAPVVNTDDLVLGVFGPEDGNLEAQSLMLGYRDAARRFGAEVYQGVAATGIKLQQGQVTGVATTDGEISAPVVVNAAGADAIEVGHWVGVALPIDNRSRSIYVTAEFPQVPADTPFVFDLSKEWYYRKEGPGVLIGMGKQKNNRTDMSINHELLPAVIDHAIHRVPALAEARIMSGWSGIRPLTADNLPILGPVDGVDGYVNDCGWGGEGVMHAPAGGQIIAELIHDGHSTTFELEPFLLSRFDG